MKKRSKRIRKDRLCIAGIGVLLLILMIYGIFKLFSPPGDDEAETAARTAVVTDENAFAEPTDVVSEPTTEQEESAQMPVVIFPEKNDKTKAFTEEYDAKNAVLINVDDHEIVACRKESDKMYPASLTKVMTLIVAVENNSDLSGKVTITAEMVDPYIALDASRAGFLPDETPTLEDVLYGMILTSGADAALAAAEYTAGSEESFVELMNVKAAEMGLKNTHFTNVVGLHDAQHYSTAEDMALILEYALQNDVCRAILSTYEYKVAPTEQNPEGLTFYSTLFSRMYGDEMPGVKILGGKTGYTDEAGNCLETYAEIGGKTYILVFCGAVTNWNNIYNTLSAYSVYCAGGEPYEPPSVY